MLANLSIVHSPMGAVNEFAARNGLQWETCLRRIIFVPPDQVAAISVIRGTRFDIYQGEDAYRFLLEAICGLHSPLVGETEVLGQFRKFRAQARFPATSWGTALRRLTADLLHDARNVRQLYLQRLGSQSYGSLARYHLKATLGIAILGAGQLAQHIIPWLVNKHEVHLFYRSQLRAGQLLSKYPELRLAEFTMADVGWKYQEAALVIAAPLSATKVDRWIEQQSVSFSLCLDLRAHSSSDSLHRPTRVITLSELFDALRHIRQTAHARIAEARAQIALIARGRAFQTQSANLGQERLCA